MKKEIALSKISAPEINWEQEKLSCLMRYAQYAERCAWAKEIPEKFSSWKEIVQP